MTDHPNARAVRNALEAMAAGNPGAVMELLADDAVLVVPGANPVAGVYRGKSEIGGFFGKLAELSERPPTMNITHLLTGGDEVVVAVWVARGRREGIDYEGTAGTIFRFRAGKVVEARNLQADQEAIDRFWSA